jgi:thioesterase domain-containing protein
MRFFLTECRFVHAVDGFTLRRLAVIVQGVWKVAVHQAAVYRDRPRALNEVKTAITAYIRNISQTDV